MKMKDMGNCCPENEKLREFRQEGEAAKGAALKTEYVNSRQTKVTDKKGKV